MLTSEHVEIIGVWIAPPAPANASRCKSCEEPRRRHSTKGNTNLPRHQLQQPAKGVLGPVVVEQTRRAPTREHAPPHVKPIPIWHRVQSDAQTI